MSKQNLTRALTRAHTLLDCVQDLVATATTSGAITSLNRAGAALLGLDDTPVERLHLADLHPPETTQTLLGEFLHHARTHGSWSGELTMLHTDGVQIPVAYKLVFIHGDGDPPELGIVARDLTGAKLAESAEERLLRELQQLKTVIDSTSDFVAMASLEGQITFVNPAGLAMCGRTDQEIHALSVADFQPQADVDKLTREVFPYVRRHGVWLGEMHFSHRDGSNIPVSQVITVVRDEAGIVIGYATIARNIQAQKEAEAEREELLAALSRLKSVIDTTTDFVALASRNRRIVYINPAGLRMIGRTDADVSKLQFSDAMPPAIRQRVDDEIFPVVEAQGHWLGELALRHREGRDIPISQAITRVRDDRGDTIGFGMIARDISATKEAAAELRAAKDAAESANRAKSEFLANMSHELRTPLNVILGFAQLLARDDDLNAHQREQIHSVGHAGQHLLGLINSVLEMSKIEAGRTSLSTHDFSLDRLLCELEDMFQMRAHTRGLELMVERGPLLPIFVHTDEAKLRQVLLNLLDNAFKFTQAGHVTVRVDYQSGRLFIAVADTGSGIATSEQDKLFQAFSQTHTGRLSQEGTGLGLSISRHFVRLLGGEFQVESTPGKGTTFRFSIVVQVPERPALAPTDTREVIGLTPGTPSPKILIVEDREPNRLVLIHLLGPLGFTLHGAINGAEALEMWKSWDPDLILMDIRMPVMDGYEATRTIRQQAPPGTRPIIIALTASAFEQDRTRMLAVGCDDVISKPFQSQKLLDRLAHHLALEYLYSDDAAVPTPESPSSEVLVKALQGQPSTWCDALRQATVRADYTRLLALISQLEPAAPQLAATLLQLTKNFEYEAICELLGQRDP